MSPLPTVIRFGRLGDMIMLTALLRFLHARYRSPCQVIGAGPWNADVYRGHPDVSASWSFARHFPFALSLSWPRVVWALHRSDPGPIYVGEHIPRQLVRVRRLLSSCAIDPGRCLFITDEPARQDEHWVDRLLRFGARTPRVAQDAEVPPLDRPWAPHLQVLDSERAARDEWIRVNGWSDRELILVQPGNFRSMSRGREKWRHVHVDDKAWPVERWVALFGMMHRHMQDAVIVLCGASQEVPMLHRIQASIGMDWVAVADLSLRQLFALCESAHSMISVDTGPAHAAAALNLPLVVLYGAESPRQWLPRSAGSPVLAVGGPPSFTRVDQLSVDSVFEGWRTVARQG